MKSGKTDPNIHGHDLYEQYRVLVGTIIKKVSVLKSVSVPNEFLLTVKIIYEAVCVKLFDVIMFL